MSLLLLIRCISQPIPTIDPLGDDPYLTLPLAERVLKYKDEGNTLVKKNDMEKAILWYTVSWLDMCSRVGV